MFFIRALYLHFAKNPSDILRKVYDSPLCFHARRLVYPSRLTFLAVVDFITDILRINCQKNGRHKLHKMTHIINVYVDISRSAYLRGGTWAISGLVDTIII